MAVMSIPYTTRLTQYWQRVVDYTHRQRDVLHIRLVIVQVLMHFIPTGAFGNVRAMLYRRAGFVNIGKKVYIHGKLDLRGIGDIYPRLHIGDHSTINNPCFIELGADVHIGKNVGIGHHAVITSSGHKLGPEHERRGNLVSKPISIGDGVWLAARVTILPGVCIGPGAFINAGSIVAKSVPANAKVVANYGSVVSILDS